jgi:ABC-type Mn2+/Zn2+ transport system permease subunit
LEFLTDPGSWWIQPFTDDPAMQRALAAALLTVVVTSVVGTWVVLRGSTYIGEALGHGVLPGVAVAVVVGGDPTFGALVAAVLLVLGVGVVQRRSPLPGESAIGLVLVGMLALTVVIAAASDSFDAHDLDALLFGSLLDTTGGDLVRQAVLVVVTVGVVLVFHRALLVLTFDETQAELLGLRPRLTETVFLMLVAVTVTASFEAVGGLLVFGFLVAPPATAALMVRRVPAVMATSIGIGTGAVVLGALLSHHLLGESSGQEGVVDALVPGTPEGMAMAAVMALVTVGAFLLVLVAQGRPADSSSR